MPHQNSPLQSSGRMYWLSAIVIFGVANAITRKLTNLGAENLIDGRNPISFCNVLFVGNLCALILLLALYQQQWRWANLKQIDGKQWLTLTVVAVLFNGLKRSTASEVSLAIGLKAIAGILSAYFILAELPTPSQYIGGAVILGGIALNQIGVQRLKATAVEPTPLPASTHEMAESVTFKGV